MEVKQLDEFRHVYVTAQLLCKFLGTQEKKFEIAMMRANELGIATEVFENRVARISLDLTFHGPIGASNSAKVEVKRLCHYFEQLYPVLKSRFPVNGITSSLQSGCQSSTPSTDLECCPSPTSSSSSVARSESPGLSRFSSPPSSRATPGISDASPPPDIEVNRISKVQQFGFPPPPRPETMESDPKDSMMMEDESNDTGFVFCIPQTGGAPIPIPTPVSSTAPALEQPPTPSLSSFFHDLNINTDVPQLTQSGPSEQTSISDLHTAPRGRKRKRDSSSTSGNLTTITGLHTKAVSAYENARRQQREARRKELELAIEKAQECAQLHLARTEPIANGTSDLGESEDSLARLQSTLADIRQEIREFDDRMLVRSLESDLSRALGVLWSFHNTIVFDFCPDDWDPRRLEVAQATQEQLHRGLAVLQNRIPPSALPALRQLHSVTSRVSRLLQTRCRLLKEREIANAPRSNSRRRRGGNGTRPSDVLKAWYAANLTNPYPTKTQRAELIERSGLSSRSLTHWFTNARSRGRIPLSHAVLLSD
jgi:Homeobox KN domain